MKGSHYVKWPTKYFNCLEIGHTFKWCTNEPLCSKCGDSHNSQDCNEFEMDFTHCFRFIQQFKNSHPYSTEDLYFDDLKFRHSATSALCPLRNKFVKK